MSELSRLIKFLRARYGKPSYIWTRSFLSESLTSLFNLSTITSILSIFFSN